MSDVIEALRRSGHPELAPPPDPLTGLITRRHFLILAEPEWLRCRREGQPLSLLLVDIDHCKRLNCCFGHEAGDCLIVHVADLCRAVARGSDIVARVRGETFAVLLPDTAIAEAERIAEHLRRRIEQTPLRTKGDSIAATVSIGVAAAHPGIDDVTAFMEAADDALLEAKRRGRNRVALAGVPDKDSGEPTLAPIR
jgi:diguanylate cyclase (GGDEF)-like protein